MASSFIGTSTDQNADLVVSNTTTHKVGIGYTSGDTLGAMLQVSGTVGIGSTNVGSAKLRVAGDVSIYDATADRDLYLSKTDGSTTIWLKSNGISYLKGGNVGIGRTDPSYQLDVKAATNSVGIRHTDGTVSIATYVNTTATSYGWLGTLSNHDFLLGANSNTSGQVFLKIDGNVGIGTTAPQQKLHVDGDFIAKGPLVDVRAYNASGSTQTTVGSINAPYLTTLNLGAAIDFKNGQGIRVYGAGAGGASLITTIVSGAGTPTLTLANAASTPVTGKWVYHDDTAAIQAAIDTGKTVIFPKATYIASSEITLGTNNQVLMLLGSTIKGIIGPRINNSVTDIWSFLINADDVTMDLGGGTLDQGCVYAKIQTQVSAYSTTITVEDVSGLKVGDMVISSWYEEGNIRPLDTASGDPLEYEYSGRVIRAINGSTKVLTLNSGMVGTGELPAGLMIGSFQWKTVFSVLKNRLKIYNGTIKQALGYYCSGDDYPVASADDGEIYFQDVYFESNGLDQFNLFSDQKLYLNRCRINKPWDVAKSGVWINAGSVYIDNCYAELGNFDSAIQIDKSTTKGEIIINNSTLDGQKDFSSSFGFLARNNLFCIQVGGGGTLNRIAVNNCRILNFAESLIASGNDYLATNQIIEVINVSNTVVGTNFCIFKYSGSENGLQVKDCTVSETVFFREAGSGELAYISGASSANVVCSPKYVNMTYSVPTAMAQNAIAAATQIIVSSVSDSGGRSPKAGDYVSILLNDGNTHITTIGSSYTYGSTTIPLDVSLPSAAASGAKVQFWSAMLALSTTNQSICLLPGNGRVGIGNIQPDAALHVGTKNSYYAGGPSNVPTVMIEGDNKNIGTSDGRTYGTVDIAMSTGGGQDTGPALTFSLDQNIYSDNSPFVGGGIKVAKQGNSNANVVYDAYMAFYTSKASAGVVERLRIDKDGGAGLSTTPSSGLHIAAGAGGPNKGYITLEELSSAPSAPGDNKSIIYMRDGHLYSKLETSETEHLIA